MFRLNSKGTLFIFSSQFVSTNFAKVLHMLMSWNWNLGGNHYLDLCNWCWRRPVLRSDYFRANCTLFFTLIVSSPTSGHVFGTNDYEMPACCWLNDWEISLLPLKRSDAWYIPAWIEKKFSRMLAQSFKGYFCELYLAILALTTLLYKLFPELMEARISGEFELLSINLGSLLLKTQNSSSV